MKVAEIEYGVAHEPNLNLNGIRVWVSYNSEGEPFVQINTPEDTDVWKRLRVYMNDGEAKTWV